MRRRQLLQRLAGAGVGALAAALPAGAAPGPARLPRKPNFLVILCDDLGYGDVGAFGSRTLKTPQIDAMAAEGVVLTDYYAPANLCTPSRAGLLTGRYPVRTGLGYEVIMQNDDRGLPLSEVALPRALKPDYVSGLFGKWHLGHRGAAWPPTRHGFDRFFGIPYSHDMKPLSLFEAHAGEAEVRAFPVDYPTLQETFAGHAEAFIRENRDRPFVVELALSAPHLPEHPRAPYSNDPRGGAYGQVVSEIDAMVGRLLALLKELHLDEDTLVVFTSDNGPWFEGSSGPLRDRKGGAAYDGGYRVPFIARWPGTLPAGRRSSAMACGIDLLPTFCAFAGLAPPAGVELDGRDLSGVLRDGAPSPHEELVLFDNEAVVAVRTQRWKYVASSYYRGIKFPLDAFGLGELFDLEADPSESYSVAAVEPEAMAAMRARYLKAKARFAPFAKGPAAALKTLPAELERRQD
jgi:arylsulfatase A-like enzyme